MIPPTPCTRSFKYFTALCEAFIAWPVWPHKLMASLQKTTRMIDSLERVRTGAVAPAGRDDIQGRFLVGEAVGVVDEEIVAWGKPLETLRDVLARLGEDAELITLLRGADAPLDDATVEELASGGDAEVELSEGGQPSYWWLLSAE